MDTTQLLYYLRDHSLEEGHTFIREHSAELSDYVAVGNTLADEALRLLYTPFVSLKMAELLIFFGEHIDHSSSYGLGLKAKGDALVQIGHFQAAMECLDQAGEEFLLLKDEGNWARSRISWIIACAWLGRVDDALHSGSKAIEVFKRLDEYYWVCVVENNMAMIYIQVGRNLDALKLYENVRAIYPTLADQNKNTIQRSIALAEGNQAVILARLGDFERAYELFQKALAGFIGLNETDLIINIENDLADLDYIRGYYGSALRRYYQALDTMSQHNADNPPLLAEIKLRIANCLVKLNRTQEACTLAKDAVEIYRSAAMSIDTADALREYATTLVASSQFYEALQALNEAWTLFSRGGFEPFAFATKLQQAELLLEMGSVSTAYDEARLANEYFRSRNLVARSTRASLIMANALIENPQVRELRQEHEQRSKYLQEAFVLCKQAASQAHQYHLREEVYKSYYLVGRIFTLDNSPAKAMRYFSAAIAQIERILADLVYDLSPSFLRTTWMVYEDMIALCLQQSQIERAFTYLEQARSIALRQYLNKSQHREGVEEDASSSSLASSNALVVRTRHALREEQENLRYYTTLIADIDYSVSPTVDREVIVQEIKRCEEKISDLFERINLYEANIPLPLQRSKYKKAHSAQFDILQLRQSLVPGQLLLAYYLYEGKLVIFAVNNQLVRTYENSDGVAQLEHLLPLLHAHLDPRGWSNAHKPQLHIITRLLHKLYTLLVAPVAGLLPAKHEHLTIVPFGPLHTLPFHALYNGSHYLVENFQINYVPASSVLTHIETKRNKKQVHTTVAEVPGVLVMGYGGNGHLQRVHEEAEAIAAMLDERCYVGEEATIERLIRQASGAAIIHLATHGQSRLDAPNFSYVRLADGQLNAIDAFSLDLKTCELVTLSGCETGLALTDGGDEQLGLGRAFLAAGASSLVMSLWPVEDNATNELMQLFYQYLLRGDSKVQALRAAQISLLHSTEMLYTHPYFWAAFRLVGDTGPLKKVKCL